MYKSIEKWLWPLLARGKKEIPANYHVLFCVCDHFEPFHQSNGDIMVAQQRMDHWKNAFPRVCSAGMDSNGNPPVHSFFYPIEQYNDKVISTLSKICSNGGGETEIHLHHHDDSYQSMVDQLMEGKENFQKHGLLSKDDNGDVVYGFIHGNWAISNSHPEGKFCGVDNELSVLKKTGCYADFTMPSVPDPCQSQIVNSVYFNNDSCPLRAHDHGQYAQVGYTAKDDELMFIQGPIALNWKERKYGFLPRIESSDLTLRNPPSMERFKLWVNSAISIEGRPEWIFVKLHTHGCNPNNIKMHLGGVLESFYKELSSFVRNVPEMSLHFVTARQMANIALAAIGGKSGNPYDYRDFRYRMQ